MLLSYLLGCVGLLHTLALLFTHWSVRFKCFVSTAHTDKVAGADMVLVAPAKAIGRPELLPLKRKKLVRGK